MPDAKQFTVHELIEHLTAFVREHAGDERLNLPVTVTEYEEQRPIRGIEFLDVTDGCQWCNDNRCAYGGPKLNDCPPNDLEAEKAGYKLEGLHWVLNLKFDSVD